MKKNHFSAAAGITKVPVEVNRAGFRKGAKPTGSVLNAVIVARRLYNGTFRKAAVVAEQAYFALQRELLREFFLYAKRTAFQLSFKLVRSANRPPMLPSSTLRDLVEMTRLTTYAMPSSAPPSHAQRKKGALQPPGNDGRAVSLIGQSTKSSSPSSSSSSSSSSYGPLTPALAPAASARPSPMM